MISMIGGSPPHDASFLVVVREFVVEMSVGLALGLAGAVVLIPVFAASGSGARAFTRARAGSRRHRLRSELARTRSGFLAVFILGLALSDARTPYKGEIERFSASLASLAELAVFVVLGLMIDISGLSGNRAWLDGIVLALVLALLPRPLFS